MIVSELELQRQELDLTRKTLIKMNESLKGFEMRPLYIELWIMKWKHLNRILQYVSDSPVKKAWGKGITFLSLHLKVKLSSVLSKCRPTVKIVRHPNF